MKQGPGRPGVMFLGWMALLCLVGGDVSAASAQDARLRDESAFRAFQFEKALSWFEKALQQKERLRDKSNARIFMFKSLCFYNLGKSKRARHSFEMALHYQRDIALPAGQSPAIVKYFAQLRKRWQKVNPPSSRKSRPPLSRIPVTRRSGTARNPNPSKESRIPVTRRSVSLSRGSQRIPPSLRPPVRRTPDGFQSSSSEPPTRSRRLPTPPNKPALRSIALSPPSSRPKQSTKSKSFVSRHLVSIVLFGGALLCTAGGVGTGLVYQEKKQKYEALSPMASGAQADEAYQAALVPGVASMALFGLAGGLGIASVVAFAMGH